MFSAQTSWNLEENRLTRAVRTERDRGAEIIDLSCSNPTQVGLAPPLDKVRQSLADGATGPYRPDPLGLGTAREAVSAYYDRRGLEVDPGRIMLVSSTSEAYAFLFRLLLNPGEGVAIGRPGYPLLEHLATLGDVVTRPYRLAYDGSWYVDRESLDSALEHAKLALVVSPNNPTGSCFSRQERAHFLERLGERALVSDEVFADFLFADRPKAASWIDGPNPLTFSLNGLSKTAGLPGLKLSWIVVSGEKALVQTALARLEMIGDTFLSVGTPVQAALPALLPLAEAWQAGLKERILENRAHLARSLRDTPCTLRPADGGWSAIVEFPNIRTDEAWALLFLQTAGVLVQPGYLFDVRGRPSLVLSLIVAPEDFARGIEGILEVTRVSS